MIPPDTLEGPARDDRPGALLSAEQLRRHLLERLEAAREELRALERRRPAPTVLVNRVGAAVAEAQRSIEAERAESELRSDALGRVAARRGSLLIAGAEAEARILRAVATWLRQVPAGALGAGAAVVEAVPAPPMPETAPVLAAMAARAS
jgi:hypothetical protein